MPDDVIIMKIELPPEDIYVTLMRDIFETDSRAHYRRVLQPRGATIDAAARMPRLMLPASTLLDG